MNTQAPAPRGLRRAGDASLAVFRVVASVGIFALMIHTLANVVGRYAFNRPLPGTTEFVAYWYMPIVAFLGFVLAKQAKELIEAPLVFDNLTWGNRRMLVITNAAIAVVMCGLFAYYTFTGDALHGLKVGAVAGVSTISIVPVLFLPPLVFVILTCMYVYDIVRAFRGHIDVDRDEDEAAFGTVPDLSDIAGFDAEPATTNPQVKK